jgi:hypothetical protein
MRRLSHISTHVHRNVGLHYLLGYALRHPEHSAQWVGAITRLLQRGGAYDR